MDEERRREKIGAADAAEDRARNVGTGLVMIVVARQVPEAEGEPSRNGSKSDSETDLVDVHCGLHELLYVRHQVVKAVEGGRVSLRSGAAGSGTKAQGRIVLAGEVEDVKNLWVPRSAGGWLDEEPNQGAEAGEEEAFGHMFAKEGRHEEEAVVDLVVVGR